MAAASFSGVSMIDERALKIVSEAASGALCAGASIFLNMDVSNLVREDLTRYAEALSAIISHRLVSEIDMLKAWHRVKLLITHPDVTSLAIQHIVHCVANKAIFAPRTPMSDDEQVRDIYYSLWEGLVLDNEKAQSIAVQYLRKQSKAVSVPLQTLAAAMCLMSQRSTHVELLDACKKLFDICSDQKNFILFSLIHMLVKLFYVE